MGKWWEGLSQADQDRIARDREIRDIVHEYVTEPRLQREREAKERLKREKVREAKRKKYAHEKDEPLWKFIWKELMG